MLVAELVPWFELRESPQTAIKDARSKEFRNAGRIEVVKIDGQAKFSVWNT